MAVEEGIVAVGQIGVGYEFVTLAVPTGWARRRGWNLGSALGTASWGATDA